MTPWFSTGRPTQPVTTIITEFPEYVEYRSTIETFCQLHQMRFNIKTQKDSQCHLILNFNLNTHGNNLPKAVCLLHTWY